MKTAKTAKTRLPKQPTPALAVGATIRRLRLQQARTQEEIALACGFTKSLLCKIEAGKSYPPIATLVRIAGALGTTVSSLLETPTAAKAIMTTLADAKLGMTSTDKGYSVFPLAQAFPKKRIQPYIFTAVRGAVTKHELVHEGEEFILIISGEVRFRVGQTDYLMHAGDSLYFDASEPHGMSPVTATATYLDIFV